MAPIQKRRRLNAPLSKDRSVGDHTVMKGSRITSLEALPWQDVPFPETFQDAEGFFGLEEISDVDVVRDSGKIEYKVH